VLGKGGPAEIAQVLPTLRSKNPEREFVPIARGTFGAESGLPIDTNGLGEKRFVITGEVIWFDGHEWRYSSHPPAHQCA
jgi:hypothetical protein